MVLTESTAIEMCRPLAQIITTMGCGMQELVKPNTEDTCN